MQHRHLHAAGALRQRGVREECDAAQLHQAARVTHPHRLHRVRCGDKASHD